MGRMRAAVKVKSPEKRARIGERIKIAATSAGMTLKELAARAGTSPALIYQYVRGITNVPPDTLQAIAAACQISLEFFDPDKDTRSAMALPAGSPGEGAPPSINRERVAADLRHLQQVADALDEPWRNVPRLVTVLHEILALARVAGDRALEAQVQARLGTLLNDMGEHEKAGGHLSEAETILAGLGPQASGARVRMELARGLAETGAVDAAIEGYLEVSTGDDTERRWAALVEAARLLWRERRHREAMDVTVLAASTVADLDDAVRQDEATPALAALLADMAAGAGHYASALATWRAAICAIDGPCRPEAYLRAQLGAADCCLHLGRLSEARQRLEQTVAVARFVLPEHSVLAGAHARLALLCTITGSCDEAREQARAAVRVALRTGNGRAFVTAALAHGTACLVAGSEAEAMSSAEEAARAALGTRMLPELARAGIVRARALLALYASERDAAALAEARAEAARAVATAARALAPADTVAAHLVLGECLEALGDDGAAADQYRQALETFESGALSLDELMGGQPTLLPPLLQAPPTDVAQLFLGREVQAPALAWRAHYLMGRLECRTGAPAAGFARIRQAASLLTDLLAGCTVEEATRIAQRDHDVAALYQSLERAALTAADQAEAVAIVRAAPWLGRPTDFVAARTAGAG